MAINVRDTSNGPSSPKLMEPPAVGSQAPSDPPSFALTKEQFDAAVKEAVAQELAVLAPEDNDPTREKLRAFEDAQFNNFDKKLEVFGVDVKDILPGFVLRWINDERDRIPRSELMGWTFVKRTEVALNEKVFPMNKDMGDNIAVYVGASEGGQAMRAFLMKIPEAGYKRLMARKEAQDDLVEDAIKRGAIGPALSNKGYAGTDQGQVKINYNPRQR